MHIDKLYRQKLSEHTVSNQNASVHWKQMQRQMRNAKRVKKIKQWSMAAGVATIATVIAFSIPSSTKKNTPSVATTTIQQEEKQSPTPQVAEANNPTITPTTENVKEENTTKASAEKNIKITTPTNATTNATEQQEAGFYIDLSKEPQLFEIDASVGGTLNCKQGTTIIIPANAIVDSKGQPKQGKTTIVVQEYYRYQGDDNKIPSAGMVKYNIYDENTQYEISSKSSVSVKMKNDVSNVKMMSAEDMIPEKQLRQMTWATNEHFFADQRTKIDYRITLEKKYNANTFMSQLVFSNHNIVVPGNIENNSLSFQKVPVGELVHFVSFGKIKNRYFSCSKKLITGNTKLGDVDFVEISATQYHELLDMYTKLSENR